jgi:predicted nuclease of predicted toxin-antitoxin system
MIKFYTDEGFPRPTTLAFRDLGYDILTCQEAGKANQNISDEDVVAFATEQNRVVLTVNCRDFIKIHRQSNHHTGIIACTEDLKFEALALRIHEAVSNHEGEFTNQLLRIYKPA